MRLLTDIKTLAALLMAGAACTACSSDDNITGEKPTANSQYTYSMTVSALKGGDTATRALSLEGKTLDGTWSKGEKVTAYNLSTSTALDGYLEAQSAGLSTKLTGSITGDIEPGDQLKLSFLKPIYSVQNGTLEYIASNCDYAEATVNVETLARASDGSGNITTDGAANFKNRQAIVKFTLKDTYGNNLYPDNLNITAASNKLLKGQLPNTPKTRHSGYTVTAGTPGVSSSEDETSLLDGNKSTKWCAWSDTWNVLLNYGTWNVTFNTASPVQVDGYTLTTGGDTEAYSERNPKNWTLKGKLNAEDKWTIIATVIDDNTLPAANTTDVNFVVDKPGRYQYFKFEVTASQNKIMQLAELQLWKASDATEPVYGPITIFPASPTNELTVALHNDSGAGDNYTLTANTDSRRPYTYKMSGVNFVDGKYYEMTVAMEEHPLPEFVILDGWKVGSDGDGGGLTVDGITITYSGSSGGYIDNEKIVYKGGTIRFSSSRGKIKQIHFQGPQIYGGTEVYSFSDGWSLNNKAMLTWSGTPATSVELTSTEDFELSFNQIIIIFE